MCDKEIKIPKVFHELHGKTSHVSTIIMVYLAGFTAAGLILSQIIGIELPLWKIILVGILYVDIGGGVVANLATSTNQYYQGKPKLRIGFILLHLVHPALFMLVFPVFWLYFGFVGLFTLASTLVINEIGDTEFQQNLAALLIVIGVAGSFFFEAPLPILYSFAPLFMIKLILGFSVRRPALNDI